MPCVQSRGGAARDPRARCPEWRLRARPMTLRLGFDEGSAVYQARAQYARVWSEGWVARELYCLNCGAPRLSKLANNNPVGDFACEACDEEYEIKSCAGRFATRVVDGAYT